MLLEEFGAIECFKLITRSGTATLPVPQKQVFLKFMSTLYIILFCNFVCN